MGKCGTMPRDYRHYRTNALFVTLNILHGAMIGGCMQKYTHQEFIHFLNAVDREIPKGKVGHAIMDNYATHKHLKVREWLVRHLNWLFHFTPTSASWLNAVERFLPIIVRQRL
jgi:hypothetical protein